MSESSLCRDDAGQRRARRPQGARRRQLAAYYRAVVGLEELSRSDGSDHARRGRPAAAGDRGATRPQAGRSAHRRPVPHRLPAAVARRSRPLDQACHRQADPDRRRVGPSGQRGALPDRSGRQRHRDLCRPPARALEMERVGRSRWRRSGSTFRACVADVPAGDAGWKGAPENSVIGHVHLRVGDPDEAEEWWHDEFGFDTDGEIRRRGRVPVVRRLSPPYRRQFLAQPRRRPPRPVALGLELGRDAVERLPRRLGEDRSLGNGDQEVPVAG